MFRKDLGDDVFVPARWVNQQTGGHDQQPLHPEHFSVSLNFEVNIVQLLGLNNAANATFSQESQRRKAEEGYGGAGNPNFIHVDCCFCMVPGFTD